MLLKTIELAVRRVHLLVQVEHLHPCFWSGRLGDIPIPAEFRNAMEEWWRFFEWFFQKILPDHCIEKSLFDYRREEIKQKSNTNPVISRVLAVFIVFIFDINCVHFRICLYYSFEHCCVLCMNALVFLKKPFGVQI